MTTELIITNGDSAVSRLKEAGMTAEILPWRDVLHDGPVPITNDLASLSQIRADFIRAQGWAPYTCASFEARDKALAASTSFNRVTLWFEHDLYDQLQLIQLLDWFANNPRTNGSLRLVQADDYLGDASPGLISSFARRLRPITDKDIQTAQTVWAAFRQPTPEIFARLIKFDTQCLPFLRPAILRMLEELPAPGTGLNRTETTILQCMANDITRPVDLFMAFQELEAHRFMGDTSFFAILDRLADAKRPPFTGLEPGPYDPHWPYIEQLETSLPSATNDKTHDPRRTYFNSTLELNEFGKSVVTGECDFAANNVIDRWWGGTHIKNENLWRWDAGTEQLLGP